MRLKFDANLEYQLDAIQAVTDLFEGLPPKHSQFEISIEKQESMLFNAKSKVAGRGNFCENVCCCRCCKSWCPFIKITFGGTIARGIKEIVMNPR